MSHRWGSDDDYLLYPEAGIPVSREAIKRGSSQRIAPTVPPFLKRSARETVPVMNAELIEGLRAEVKRTETLHSCLSEEYEAQCRILEADSVRDHLLAAHHLAWGNRAYRTFCVLAPLFGLLAFGGLITR